MQRMASLTKLPPGPALEAAGAEAGVVYIGAGALVAIELFVCIENKSAYPIECRSES